MAFVSEQQIDEVLVAIASEGNSEAGINSLQEEQPMILAYLLSDHFNVFSNEERAYMLYLAIVIWRAVKACFSSVPEITEQQLGTAEESNWELLQSASTGSFSDRLNIFFKDYAQEDLLAFVEDAITEDEDSAVSMEGREPIFIALKSIIDCLTANSSNN